MAEKFRSHYTVTIGDINYGGHLGNERALVIFQDARIRLLRELGCSEKEIGGDAGIIMVESGVRYLREVFLHDELVVCLAVKELKAKKFTLGYEISRQADDRVVLSGFTSFLAFDYNRRKVAPIPREFSDRLARYLETT